MSTRIAKAVEVDATSLKMSLGQIGQRVKSQDLRVTKHGRTQAIVISPGRYERLLELEETVHPSLDQSSAEFDALVLAMQTPEQGAAMNRLMTAPEDEVLDTLRAHYAKHPVPQWRDQGSLGSASSQSIKGVIRAAQVMVANGPMTLEVKSVKGKAARHPVERLERVLVMGVGTGSAGNRVRAKAKKAKGESTALPVQAGDRKKKVEPK